MQGGVSVAAAGQHPAGARIAKQVQPPLDHWLPHLYLPPALLRCCPLVAASSPARAHPAPAVMPRRTASSFRPDTPVSHRSRTAAAVRPAGTRAVAMANLHHHRLPQVPYASSLSAEPSAAGNPPYGNPPRSPDVSPSNDPSRWPSVPPSRSSR